jgi:hypothetical protein
VVVKPEQVQLVLEQVKQGVVESVQLVLEKAKQGVVESVQLVQVLHQPPHAR